MKKQITVITLFLLLQACSNHDQKQETDNMSFGTANPAMKEVNNGNGVSPDTSKMDSQKKSLVSTGSAGTIIDTHTVYHPAAAPVANPKPSTATEITLNTTTAKPADKGTQPRSITAVVDQKPVRRSEKKVKPSSATQEPAEEEAEEFNTIYFHSKGDGNANTSASNATRSAKKNQAASSEQIKAVLPSGKVRPGGTVLFQLKEDVTLEDLNVTLPAGEKIAAIVNYDGGRAMFQFNSAIVNGKVIKINFRVYDSRDGLEGIDIGDQSVATGKSNGVKNAIGQTASNVASLLPGVGGQAARNVTNGVSSGIMSRETPRNIPGSTVILVPVKSLF